jgi:LacI family transcriptional regulator
LPVVLIDPIGARSGALSVGSTNWAGGMAAANHLLSLGHRRIAYIGGPLRATCDQARGHGYLAAMRAAGIKVNLDAAPHGPFTFEHGLTAGESVLAATDRPSAIFAGSDRIALGVLEAARTLGLRTPEDLSVVGFDDTLLASTSTPRLTTIHQPMEEIGRTAVRVIVGVITGDDVAARPMELSTHLVIRDSTARLTKILSAPSPINDESPRTARQ